MIKRAYNINELIKPNKALIIYGPRRVGKTTFLQSFLKDTTLKYKIDSGDNIKVRQILGSQDFKQILEYVEGYELYAIDEAQQIPSIGMALKILVDNIKDMHIIATGSSSFDLSSMTGEPLTGRKTTILIYPFAQKELLALYNRFELKENLEDFLIFGSYPDVINAANKKEKIEVLEELVNSYLLKDVLALDNLKSSKTLIDILKLLAFQVGNLVSFNEIAVKLRIDVKTVAKYLDVLEKTFVIKKLGGFSRNLRNEITAKAKYYFVDNGIRNAVVSQFNSLENRNDTGMLWENFIFMERIKKLTYERVMPVSFYFWRTYDGKEVDLVEENEGILSSYEFKWSKYKNNNKTRELWNSTYPNVPLSVINNQNYLDFVL